MDQPLPFSNRSHTGILDEAGERIVPVGDVCARLSVDGLIRLHRHDYDLVEELEHEYVHFNLEATLNEAGKSYAIVPIARSGHSVGPAAQRRSASSRVRGLRPRT